ncbi:MAG: MraY family glycosyltransferase [Aliarcobacter sp.]|nr:MraY family glycosyltransferase [Aliarcobacter sp.]
MITIKLIFTFLSSLLFIKFIIKNASFLGLTDIPNERSSHTKITPRGAGIGFGFAFFTTILLFNFSLFIEYWLLFLGIFLVFLVGILDDHKDASPKAKFYAIFIATFLLYLSDISIYSLGSFFGFEISLWYFALPFTMFALAGFTNALNLIDGLDGLAGTITIIILSSFLYIGYIYNDELMIILCRITIVSLLAFLVFNWNPAKIFMGDSGSLFLGFVVSVVACLSLKYIHPIAVFYLAAIPIVDTLVVMTRRIRKGISPFTPDKTHIHHILLKFFGKRVKKTVFFLGLMQVLFSLVGLMLSFNSEDIGKGATSTVALIAFVGITMLFYMIFTGMKRRQKLIEKTCP